MQTLTAKETAKPISIARCEMNTANGNPQSASETLTWLDMHGGSQADGGLLSSLEKRA